MAVTADPKTRNSLLNVPNQLTALRLVMAVVMFTLIPLEYYLTALVVFVIAASTDWVDGYWARRYGQVTKFGRIFDPFADKFIICGAFIFLAAEWPQSGVHAWMAVVVVGREMLVTAIRSFIEQAGGDFSANMSGKLKMVFQCVAVGLSLIVLSYQQPPQWLVWSLHISVWLAVLSTVYSGAVYLVGAVRLLHD